MAYGCVIDRHQRCVRVMVIASCSLQPAGDSSHDALSDEHSNPILKMKSCLEAKGCLQTSVALAWGRPKPCSEMDSHRRRCARWTAWIEQLAQVLQGVPMGEGPHACTCMISADLMAITAA